MASSSSSGFVFCPDKYECIGILLSKLVGDPLPCCDDGYVLDDLNPYDENNLPSIFKHAQDKDLYFFAKLTRKGKSGSTNVKRTAGKGTWHGEQANKVVYDDAGQGVEVILGTEHTFKYQEKGSKHDNGYLMTEYRLLDDTCLEYDVLKHGVFCVLKLNTSGVKDPIKKKRKIMSHVSNDASSTKKVCRSSDDDQEDVSHDHQTSVGADQEAAVNHGSCWNPASSYAAAADPFYCRINEGEAQNENVGFSSFETSWEEGELQGMMMREEEFQVGFQNENVRSSDRQLSLLERMQQFDVDFQVAAAAPSASPAGNNYSDEQEAAANPVSCWNLATSYASAADPFSCWVGEEEQMNLA